MSNSRKAQIAWLLMTAAAIAAHGAVSVEPFGRVDNQAVQVYRLTNAHGLEVRITPYGATIVSLKTPDRRGTFRNVVLGFDRLEDYRTGGSYFGATVGRYANRMARGRFELDGMPHQLTVNDGVNSLHGGRKGFDKQVWSARAAPHDNAVRLSYDSPAGEEGYPGNAHAQVIYRLGEDDSLRIEYRVTTDAATPINLVNHAYFNLTGDPRQSILAHRLRIAADRFTPVDATLIPTGELRSVVSTPFDFREDAMVGSRIEAQDEQLRLGKGYDHNWVLNKPSGRYGLASVLSEPSTGRVMEVYTTQPGLQFYSGNSRTGLCLETQHFPDSPNHPAFPSTIVRPGEVYRETTVLRFRVMT